MFGDAGSEKQAPPSRCGDEGAGMLSGAAKRVQCLTVVPEVCKMHHLYRARWVFGHSTQMLAGPMQDPIPQAGPCGRVFNTSDGPREN